MEMSKKFQMATSCHVVNIDSLEIDRKYPIIKAERVTTSFRESILLCIQNSITFNLFKIFLPKIYAETFTDDDLNAINTEKFKSHLYWNMCSNKILQLGNRIKKLVTFYLQIWTLQANSKMLQTVYS